MRGPLTSVENANMNESKEDVFPGAENAGNKAKGRTFSIKLTQPSLFHRRESEGLFSSLPTEEHSSPLIPKGPKALFGLQESQQALLTQIRMINVKLGRDSNACIRHLSAPKSAQGAKPEEIPGFRKVERTDSRPALLYMKSIISAPHSKQQSMSPSQRIAAERREMAKRQRMTSSERSLLKASLDHKTQIAKERIETRLSRDLSKLNRLQVFPKLVNEVRVRSLVSVRLQHELQFSLREFSLKEKDRVIGSRSSRLPHVVLLTSEEQERQVQEERRALVSHLETRLVDKIAKAETRLRKEEENAVQALTGEEISIKLSRMMAESKKRQPTLQRLRNLPIAEIANRKKQP